MAPTFPALDLALFRQHCRALNNDEDALLVEYIEAATDYAEQHQSRCLRQSTWQAVYDGFPACDWRLPNPRLQSVSSIVYLDSNGASQTLATSVYVVDATTEPGRIALAYGQTWPATLDRINTVTVTFVAGYANASQIPARTRQAIRILAAHWYMTREPIIVGASVANVPLSVMDLLEADRLLSYR